MVAVQEVQVTVLLSRARDALIMVGNVDTFMEARKGSESWKILLDLLRSKGHLYEGFPAKCEQHPNEATLLRCAHDFDRYCPHGGCRQPWCVQLSHIRLTPDRRLILTTFPSAESD